MRETAAGLNICLSTPTATHGMCGEVGLCSKPTWVVQSQVKSVCTDLVVRLTRSGMTGLLLVTEVRGLTYQWCHHQPQVKDWLRTSTLLAVSREKTKGVTPLTSHLSRHV
jgi:hypothetical protein